jgi:hypothetical protein
MKLVTTKFKSGGQHEKHVVATWNLGNQFLQLFYFILGFPIRVSLQRAKRNEPNSPPEEGTAIISSPARSVISGFRLEAYEIFVLLGYYAG